MKLIRLWAAALLFALTVGIGNSQQGWQLVWADEVNGAANTAPDPAKWTYDLGSSGWGNRELKNYPKDPANAHMDGQGPLVIHAEQVRTDNTPGAYASARLKTQG